MVNLAALNVARTVTVPVAPDSAYALVADVTRMGEWSPACTGGAWDEGTEGATVGAWFTGTNKFRETEWETRCEIVAATPGEEIAWVVGGAEEGTTRWGYAFRPVESGTEIEESWKILRLHEQMAAMDNEQIAKLLARTEKGIDATLAAIAAAT